MAADAGGTRVIDLSMGSSSPCHKRPKIIDMVFFSTADVLDHTFEEDSSNKRKKAGAKQEEQKTAQQQQQQERQEQQQHQPGVPVRIELDASQLREMEMMSTLETCSSKETLTPRLKSATALSSLSSIQQQQLQERQHQESKTLQAVLLDFLPGDLNQGCPAVTVLKQAGGSLQQPTVESTTGGYMAASLFPDEVPSDPYVHVPSVKAVAFSPEGEPITRQIGDLCVFSCKFCPEKHTAWGKMSQVLISAIHPYFIDIASATYGRS